MVPTDRANRRCRREARCRAGARVCTHIDLVSDGQSNMTSVLRTRNSARNDVEHSDHAMRFLREAMMTSRIDHPNVISAIDYGTCEQGAYLIMTLIEGPTLAHVMRLECPMSWARAAEIGAQIADAAAAAQTQ